MSEAASTTDSIEIDAIGREIYALAAEIFPICRSITGEGVRRTIDLLARHIPIQRHELPTGTPVLDWTIPKEWGISDAFIKNSQGERVVDFQRSNLHVVNYSAPVRQILSITQLKQHIFTLPDQPDLVPYRTAFYKEEWGFCTSHRQLEALEAAGGSYEVLIDSRLEPGTLTWGEYLHVGDSTDEVLISTHICHPSLANDNCSGLALATLLARELSGRQTRPCSAASSTASSSAMWEMQGLPRTNGAVGPMLLSIRRCRTCYGDPAHPIICSILFPTGTMSVNIAPRVSICQWGFSSAASTEPFPSITLRPITSTSFGLNTWRSPFA
jgi:hypothetical protein